MESQDINEGQGTAGESEAQKLRVGGRVRFVILHHTGIPEAHFDLLIEVPGCEGLWSWRIEEAPETWGHVPSLATRIADHRRIYLEYEGEISGGRGNVRRVSEGMGEVTELTKGEIGLRAGGRIIRLPLIRNEM